VRLILRVAGIFSLFPFLGYPAEPKVRKDWVSFEGQITPYLLDNFIAGTPMEGVTRLVVSSSGGDIGAALKFGWWIREHQLDVEVKGACLSACANYLLPAGKRKIIGAGAVVAWHGSMEQRDIREFVARYENAAMKLAGNPDSLDAEERAFLADNRSKFKIATELREQQRRFFQEVQVDESITRLGQEPVDYGIDFWVATGPLMARFGLVNLEVPPDYATPAYMDKTPLFITQGGNHLIFNLGKDGSAVAQVIRRDNSPLPSLPTSRR
jgi:hypothetical protein